MSPDGAWPKAQTYGLPLPHRRLASAFESRATLCRAGALHLCRRGGAAADRVAGRSRKSPRLSFRSGRRSRPPSVKMPLPNSRKPRQMPGQIIFCRSRRQWPWVDFRLCFPSSAGVCHEKHLHHRRPDPCCQHQHCRSPDLERRKFTAAAGSSNSIDLALHRSMSMRARRWASASTTPPGCRGLSLVWTCMARRSISRCPTAG